MSKSIFKIKVDIISYYMSIKSIDEQPIAAASIAQVHRALLKDHHEVVLKVGHKSYLNYNKCLY